MIDVQDLRIGNLVTVNNEKYHPSLKGIPLEVTGISEASEDRWAISLKHINQKRNTFYQTYSQFIKYLDPIQLTPEILEAAGLKYREHLDDHYIRISEFNDRSDILILSKYNTLVCASNSQPVFFKHVTSLHQLQNLYHSLTGEEFKIKLPTTVKE